MRNITGIIVERTDARKQKKEKSIRSKRVSDEKKHALTKSRSRFRKKINMANLSHSFFNITS